MGALSDISPSYELVWCFLCQTEAPIERGLALINFPRYIRTLRHLRWSQLVGQVRVRVAQRLMTPSTFRSRGWGLDDRKLLLNLSGPVPAQDARALAAGRFEFLGEQVNLGSSPDWLAAGQSRLWKYNLHYFDWLWSLLYAVDDNWESAKDLTLDWIEHYSPTKEACGWEPYPTSLRLMNWCLLYGLKHKEKLAKDSAFRDILLDSIGRQVAWLERNLETHIQANHLLENLCALVCVASVLKGPCRRRLLKCYQPQLVREIQEQILPDGMHYERSPMYHLRVMWLMEMLKEVGDSSIQELVSDPLERAKVALVCMSHPDGEIAQFNDAAIGIYADTWSKQAREGAWSLPKAGYYGYRHDGDYLVIDSGPIGPDHQPGHAHADMLSFELSLSGQRVITDTGISTYKVCAQRSYDRSTAAHSTLEIAGQDSVEVWGGFRVARRTKPNVLRWKPVANGVLLEAEHDGYTHLPGKPVHRRCFEWRDGALEIRDQVSSKREVEVTIRFLMAPEIKGVLEGQVWRGQVDDLGFELQVDGPGQIKVEQAEACRHFGVAQARDVLVIRVNAEPPTTRWAFLIRKV